MSSDSHAEYSAAAAAALSSILTEGMLTSMCGLVKGEAGELQTPLLSDARINPAWWKTGASEEEEVMSLTWGI